MKQNKNINTEIEKTLNAYSTIEKPSLSPYFASKLKARMEAQQQKSKVLNPSFAVKFAIAIFFVLINSVSLFNYLNNQNLQQEQNAISSLETEYSVNATNLYAYNFDE